MAKKKQEKDLAKLSDYRRILGPVITEKATNVGKKGAFGLVIKVQQDSTKNEIRESIENIFNVKVEDVRTCNYLGKPKRSGRSVGRRSSYKKAYISLKEGYSIDLYEGV